MIQSDDPVISLMALPVGMIEYCSEAMRSLPLKRSLARLILAQLPDQNPVLAFA
ncbi:hypothetical protein [Arthrobacter sp. NicSoilB8]|uniref:hypothetical protein n=1 Tax=Arthrobacter sp. NicSoilB8 TaxID=2830998 RepID=UPI001CC4DF03|nr:hypothetical protein [Arthrobacter sp. NicSoilB8]